MNAPSRDFMIRQAVLNWAHQAAGKFARNFLRNIDADINSRLEVIGPCFREVREEYRAIAAQYSQEPA